jgi:hypothetical protein
MDTTGNALVDHWNWAVSKGLMNRNTGNSLRAACAKVLPVMEGWEELDVRELDVEDVLKRFVNLRSQEYKPDSLEAYKRRFRQAVTSFLEYADDPAAWKPAQREPRQPKNGGNGTQSKGAQHKQAEVGARGELKGSNLHEYDFPLREDVMAKLVVPRDVTNTEMKRLIAWARTLAIDFDNGAL